MFNPAAVILLFAVIESPRLVRAVLLLIRPIEKRRGPRVTTGRMVGLLIQLLVELAAVCWILDQESLRELIFPSQAIDYRVIVAGAVIWAILTQVERLLHFEKRDPRRALRDSVAMYRYIVPRSRTGQRIMVACLCINPVTEEIIYRGVFVRLVHEVTGSAAVGVGFGLGICLLVHGYQGVRALPWHAVFFGVTTALMYSRAGLATAIVVHLLADLQPVFQNIRWMKMGQWRTRTGSL